MKGENGFLRRGLWVKMGFSRPVLQHLELTDEVQEVCYNLKISYEKVLDEDDVTMIVDEIKKYDEEITNFETKRDHYKKLLNDISKVTEDEEDETLTEESNKQEFDVPYNSSCGYLMR